MNLALFGAPGCGKGTQAQMLTKHLGMIQVSTGDLFRAAIKGGTPVGKKAKSFLDAGHLVPDEVVVEVVKEAIEGLKKPFILDGFPRTLNQARALNSMLSELKISIGKFVFIEVPDEILTKRITGRRVCRNCGAIYHADTKPELKSGVCDSCGGEVYQRSDDKLELVSERLNVYYQQTEPLKKFYRDQGSYVEVNGDRATQEIFEDLLKILKG